MSLVRSVAVKEEANAPLLMPSMAAPIHGEAMRRHTVGAAAVTGTTSFEWQEDLSARQHGALWSSAKRG
eukprot:CAMPEP_0115719810 /NCGR_PEP_ID=MMETSP0272-20121206/78192_1 /TAXON_ID=71861 /ORGANISM="Scrippsiella trochoidea, Strain CCMP3099" /LENGTH=68 /DNA_ID=CAMNT_0003162489 /DNA_START=9 /DNA_END=210 /DNA_ORIENTATION=-